MWDASRRYAGTIAFARVSKPHPRADLPQPAGVRDLEALDAAGAHDA